MNQVLTREELAALLQGVAEAESDRLEPGQAKKTKPPYTLYKSRVSRKVQRYYLVDSPR